MNHLKELNELSANYSLYYQRIGGNPLEFEATWSDCTVSIGEAYKSSQTKDKRNKI